jgi:sodium transport system ATP-binding protein
LSEPVVEVRGLRKTFEDEARGQVEAVAGVDFECRAGEIFGLLGANGAGKTTTLRMLATLLRPTAGSVRVLGRDAVAEPTQARRSLGFYSASTALYPRLTPRETIELFARIGGVPVEAAAARVDALVARFGIGPYQHSRVERLSSGMKQKVSVARALAHAPPLLVFDEPTVGLDVLNALEMVEIVKELRAEGKAIVYSTHIMSEAEKLCDRIAILHRGRILACDSLDGLRRATGAHYLEDIFVHYLRGAP